MVAFTEGGKGAVVMINLQGQPILYEILRAIAKEYNWLGYVPRERTVVNVDPKAYDAYVGRYLDPDQPDGVINISVKDGKLLFNGDSLLAESETRFFDTTNSDYTFVKDENGGVKELLVQFVDPPLKLVAKRIR